MHESGAGSRIGRWVRRGMMVMAIGVTGLVTAGVTYQEIGTARDARSLAAPGRLIDVGGYRLHLTCSGAGSPTVILEHGLGSPSVSWAWVQAGVAPFTRVCSYDRAGYGWSEPSPQPRVAAVMATELHTLLARAGERGPYVLVAHSFGGIVGRVFASRYAADVAGAVFVDASHPAQFSTACVPACLPHQVVERSASLYRTTPWLASLGALRLGSQLGLVPFAQASAGLTPRESQIIAAEFTKTAYWRTSAAEFRGIPESAAQAAAVRSLGSRPLRVLVAGHTYYTDEIKAFTGDINPDQVSRSWLTLERDLARLSTRSSLEVVPEASHVSLITDPRYAARVVAAVKDVVQEVRTAPTSR